MSQEKEPNDSEIIWKGSTVLLTIILALALVSWVSERKALIANSSHSASPVVHHDNPAHEEALDAVAAEADGARAALEKAKIENAMLESRVKGLKEKLANFSGEEGKLNERIASSTKETSQLAEQLSMARAALAKSEKKNRANRVQLVRMEEYRDSLLREKKKWERSSSTNSASSAAKTKKYEQELAALRLENSEKTKQIRAAHGQVDSATKAEAKFENLRKQLEKNQLEADGLKKKLYSSQRKSSALAKQLESERNNSERLRGVVDAKRSELESMIREFAEVETDANELVKTKKQVKSLKSDLADEKRKNQALNTDLKNNRRDAELNAAMLKDAMVVIKKMEESENKRPKAKKSKPINIAIVTAAGSDLKAEAKVLRAKVKNMTRELRRVSMERDALIEEFKRSNNRIRKLKDQIEALRH